MKAFVLLLLTISVLCNAQPTVPGDYPQGSTQLLTEADLQDLDGQQLAIMRNEIFARYGHIFKKPELRDYFLSQDWYNPRFADVTSKLTDIEKTNVKLIIACEVKFRPIAIENLPRLTLPIDLENGFNYNKVSNVLGIQPTSEDGDSPTGYFGLLPDTTRYYGVLWITNVRLIRPAGALSLPVYYVTTYTKKLKQITSVAVTLALGGYDEGPTDCDNSDFVHESVIKPDLSYSSSVTFKAKCPHEESETMSIGVAGQIKSDGTIAVYKRN